MAQRVRIGEYAGFSGFKTVDYRTRVNRKWYSLFHALPDAYTSGNAFQSITHQVAIEATATFQVNQ